MSPLSKTKAKATVARNQGSPSGWVPTSEPCMIMIHYSLEVRLDQNIHNIYSGPSG